MGRKRVHFERCSYQGCTAYPVGGRKRCVEHHGWRLEAAERGERPPKPNRDAQWCDPCQAWVDKLLHYPISAISEPRLSSPA